MDADKSVKILYYCDACRLKGAVEIILVERRKMSISFYFHLLSPAPQLASGSEVKQ